MVFPMPGIPWDEMSIRWIHCCKGTHRNDDMRAVSVPSDDLQPVDRVRIAHHIIQYLWAVFLNPSKHKHRFPLVRNHYDAPRQFIRSVCWASGLCFRRRRHVGDREELRVRYVTKSRPNVTRRELSDFRSGLPGMPLVDDDDECTFVAVEKGFANR